MSLLSAPALPVLFTQAEDSGPKDYDLTLALEGRTITSVTAVGNGTLTIINAGTGLRFTPDPNVNGSEGFTYTLSDATPVVSTWTITGITDPISVTTPPALAAPKINSAVSSFFTPGVYSSTLTPINTTVEYRVNGLIVASSYVLQAGDDLTTLQVTETPSNADGPGTPQVVSDTITYTAPTANEELVAQTFYTGTGVQTYDVSFDFNDAVGGAYSVPGAPTGVSINASGVVQINTATTGELTGVGITVRYQNSGGFDETSFDLDVDGVPVNTAIPSFTGTEEVDQTLVGNRGTFTNNPTSYTDQWYRSADGLPPWTLISGADALNYLLQGADEANYVRLGVTPTNPAGTGDEAFSVASGVIAASSGAAAPLLSALTITQDGDTDNFQITADVPCRVYWRRNATGVDPDAPTIAAGGGFDSGFFDIIAGPNSVNATFAAGNDGLQQLSLTARVLPSGDYAIPLRDSIDVDTSALAYQSSVPAAAATDVDVATDPSVTLDDTTVVQATGTIELYDLTGDTVLDTYDVAVPGDLGTGAGQLEISGSTIIAHRSADLPAGSVIQVRTSGQPFEDDAGNALPDGVLLSFTTISVSVDVAPVAGVAYEVPISSRDTYPLPPGTQQGDLIIAVVAFDNNSAAQIFHDTGTIQHDSADSFPGCKVFTRFVGASDPGLDFENTDGSRRMALAIGTLRFVDPTTPIAVALVNNNNSMTPLPLTPTEAGQMSVIMMAVDDRNVTTFLNSNVPAGYTVLAAGGAGASTGTDATAAIAYRVAPDTSEMAPGEWNHLQSEPEDTLHMIVGKA